MEGAQPATALSILLNLPEERVQRDLRAATLDLEAFAARIEEFDARHPRDRTPAAQAELYHGRLVQAHAFSKVEHLPDDLCLFNASRVIEGISDEAVVLAFNSPGRLSALRGELEAIERREGLARDEFWSRGEGPPDYEALQQQTEEAIDRVLDVVMLFLFERYGMERYAALYANERMVYDVMREAGRVILRGGFEAVETDEHAGAFLAEKHGPEALRLLRRRLDLMRDNG